VTATRVGRDGTLLLGFERRGQATVLARCRFTLPLQVLTPVALDDTAAVVSILNPTGGLVGGDRLRIDVNVGAGAHACLTTPSATKVYRTAGEVAVQEAQLRVGPDATLEWVPDHTIPFAGSAFRQSIDIDVSAGARLIVVDAFAAGRVAREERWQFRVLESALRVRDAAGWLLLDRFALGAGPWEGLGFTEGAPYFATMVVVGKAAGEARVALATAASALCGSRAAIGMSRRGAVVVRCLAPSAPALTDAIDVLWGTARQALLGVAPPALRKG
jgi:urease accessory protein